MLGPLKPCPYCGAPASLASEPESYGYYPRAVWIECSSCKAKNAKKYCSTWEKGVGMIYHDEQTEAEVIGNWNRRSVDLTGLQEAIGVSEPMTTAPSYGDFVSYGIQSRGLTPTQNQRADSGGSHRAARTEDEHISGTAQELNIKKLRRKK